MTTGKRDVTPNGSANDRQNRVKVNVGWLKRMNDRGLVRHLHNAQNVDQNQNNDGRQDLHSPINGHKSIFNYQDNN